MRTRSCNLVRATLVACGTIGLLASLSSAQQFQKSDPSQMKKVDPAQVQKKNQPPVSTGLNPGSKTANGTPFGTTFTGINAATPVHHAAGGTVRGPGDAADDCGSAPIVGEGSFNYNLAGFAAGADITTCAFNDIIDGWWQYVPTTTGNASITTCGNAGDTVMSLWSGCGGTQIACLDDSCGLLQTVNFAVTAGNPVWLRIAGYNGTSPAGVATITVAAPPGGDEESCGANNPLLVLDTPAFADNSGAFTDVEMTTCAFGGAPTTGDLYWRFTAPADNTYRFSTCGSSLDTHISVFGACPIDPFGPLGCNDDACGGTLQSATDVFVSSGQTVWVRVAGWNGSAGAFQVQVTLPPPPADCVVCPPGAVDENEADCGLLGDFVNGGCNSAPPVFTSIAVGQTACGTGAFDGATRDTDWYEFTITESTEITWDVTAEFPVLIGLIAAPCPATAFIVGTDQVAGACTQVISTACLTPGTYYAFVAPQFIEAFGCTAGAGNRYTATLGGIPCFPVIPPNDECSGSIALTQGVTEFGDNTNGNTTTVVDACTFGAAPSTGDVFYSFTPATTDNYIVSTCGSALDTVLAVFTSCPGDQFVDMVGCNDDFCGLQSQVTVAMTAGVTYTIRVAGWNGAVGTFVVLADIAPPPADCAACPPGGINENEPDCGLLGDTVNGGCNSAPPVFTSIAVGQTACGTGAFDGTTRDTDWYEFTLTSDTQVTWTVTAEFDLLIGFLPGVCPATAFIDGTAQTTTEPCITIASTACLPAGTYYAFVAPQFTEQFGCSGGAGTRYVATLSGVPCTPPEPPANDDCVNAIVVSAPSSTSGTTVAAAPSGTATCGANSPDVFYSLTAPVTGSYTIDTCAFGTFDTRLSIFTDCPTLTQIACNDDFCGLLSSITLDLTAGTTYLIRVSAFGATASGDFTLTIGGPPVATGGCCVAGVCSITTQAGCSGTYLGDGTNCGSISGGTVTLSTPNAAIPDSGAGSLTDTLTGAGGTITSMNVGLNITHTWQGDLRVDLTHNSTNTTVTLVNQPGTPGPGQGFGFSADNYGAPGTPFVLSDSAATTYDAPQVAAPGIANVSGSWLPDLGPLSAFNGLNANSGWTLTITDNAGGDTGTLNSWFINVNPSVSSPCDPEFCDADWCQDGDVGVPDIFCFLSDWFANDPVARNYGGTNGVPAIFAFLSVWFATGTGPCP